MFVKVFDRNSRLEDISHSSVSRVEECWDGNSRIVTHSCDVFYARHPAAIVRKALTLFAGMMGGREDGLFRLPSLEGAELNTTSGLDLDLTKENIEIVETASSANAEGSVDLDKTHRRIRPWLYDKDSALQELRSAEERLRLTPIGELITGKGIYMGIWEPRDRDEKSLGKTFHVFAAPEDMKDGQEKLTASFVDMANAVTQLRNWHGNDGAEIKNDVILYAGLMEGSIIGKWFIPPIELLEGSAKKGFAEYLLKNKDLPIFAGNLTTHGSGNKAEYWSCTAREINGTPRRTICFSNGELRYGDDYRRLCRPFRVEPAIARGLVCAP